MTTLVQVQLPRCSVLHVNCIYICCVKNIYLCCMHAQSVCACCRTEAQLCHCYS